MKLSYNLTLEQSQKLIMTPELRQAIELLQLNTVELNSYIIKELEENPMLESTAELSQEESLEEHRTEEVDWSEYFDKSSSYEYRSEIDKNVEQTNFEAFIKDEPTLNEYLIGQLNLSKISPVDNVIGRNIIRSLDEDGYLGLDLEVIAKKLDVSEERVEEVLYEIQKFDPLGIGARSLEECLIIQAEYDNCTLVTKRIIKDHLEDLAYNRVSKVSKALKIDEAEVEKAFEYIRGLEPKPGRYLSGNCDEIRYIHPDAEIQYIDGEFKVILNDTTSPRLNINNFYRRMLRNNKDEETVDFLNERLNRALWVINSIEQRRNTIRKVLESIVRFQGEFLLYGEHSLKPLTMKQVAEDIDMHESTVSRATTGKYVQTPQGLFELKYFFTTGLLGINGDVSATSIKHKIRELIDKEDASSPYSDQKISELLKENGVRVSRRTVAKYRNEMNILSSSMRRG